MKFKDMQLEQCYERNFVDTIGFSEDLREVCALLAVYDFFRMLEGPHSERVDEALHMLISPELRPALHEWYQRNSTNLNAAEAALRDHLGQLTGERFGSGGSDAICNPS